jgi:DNA-nicking Smr family endonuclease
MVKQRSTDHPAAEHTDAQAFREAVRDVKPLAHTPPAAGLAKPKPRVRVRKAGVSRIENLDEVMPLLATASSRDDETSSVGAIGSLGASAGAGPADGALSFQRGGVRTQVMRRLRRGLYPIDDELDLHGLTQTAARERLAEFLEHSRDAGYRCVRIIHGKGYRSGARGPVLKTAVNLWLRRHLDVMAFVSARTIDGGTGAVYVLLRA